MIIDGKHLGLSEKEYRLLSLNSYSSIKDFIQSRLKYYKKYILHEKVDESKEQEKEDMRFGNICDCLKFTPDEFEDRYIISCANKPSGQMLEFVEVLHRLVIKNTNEYGVLCGNLVDLIEESYECLVKKSANNKLRDSLDKFKQRFLEDKEGYDFFLELKERENKIVITVEELEWAQKTVDYMNHHPHTAPIMSLVSNEKYEVVYQIMLKGVINGMEMKMMGDMAIFNKEKMTCQPLDLKVMGNVEMFPYNYLKFKYFIQNGTYTSLLRQNFPEYKIDPLWFVTIDKYKQSDPIIKKTSEKDFQDALGGFTIDGRKYKGLNQAIEELQWHKESGIWTSSKSVHDNHGYEDLVLNGTYSD